MHSWVGGRFGDSLRANWGGLGTPWVAEAKRYWVAAVRGHVAALWERSSLGFFQDAYPLLVLVPGFPNEIAMALHWL